MNEAPKPSYAWPRFWVPRSGVIDLSDGGFFVDPMGQYAPWSVGRRLSELSAYRALALLGEPGIGKSTTLQAEAERLRTQQDVASIHVDLRAFSSEALLYKKLFESETFTAWVNGTANLILQLDSLDEALLRIDSIGSLLADELPNYPTARLSIRIACRTAVWPSSTLEPSLNRIWGEAAVGFYELAPLRRKDVVHAAEARGINADSFFREVYASNVVPFAIKPLTLNMLLNLFQKDGKLPRNVAEIYSRGCLAFCEELNPSRRDAGRFGSFTAAQKLRVASRVAAATMFANRYAVWTGPLGENVPDEDVPLHSLDGSQEHGDFPSFEVTEAAIRETLDTGLFTSRGSNRMGWAHQGYAEFLAAEYLEAKGIPAATMLKLIMHPSGGLVPQLGVVTAWIASIDKNVRQKLIQLDPMILMQGDLTGLGDSDLENLVSSLMTALDEGRTHDFTSGPFSVGVWAFYDKLNHPGLADQLRPYINDPNKNVVSRQTAISVAKRCRLRELQPDLLKLALDTTSDAHLRGRAVDALGQCGDDTVPTKLLPLAMGELGDDPHDEMRGYALEIVWPAHLDTKTLFSLLRPPNESFYGSYVQFLTTTIPEKLAVEHLPIALDWCASLVDRHGSNGDFHRRSLADSVFILAWKHLDRAEIMKSLLAYVLALFRGFHDLFRGSGIREVEAFKEELANNPARRRLFLLAAARSGLGDTDAFHLRRAQLLRTVDLDWLLNLSPGSPGHDSTIDGHTLCTLIKSLADLNNAKHLDAIYETATKWSLLWQAFRYVFEGIPLGSLDAKQLRDSHKRTLEIESRVRPPIAPEPEKKVAEELKKFDEGDLNAWWRLNLFLALTPTARGFDSDFDFSIGKMRGWVNANDSTKLRILKAARRYLTDAENVAAKWVGKNPQPTYRSDMAAFRALILLKEFDQGSYQDIPAEVWKKWAPVCAGIAAIPRSGDDGSLERQVIADALKLAPAEFVGTIRGIMRAERQRVADGARESAPIRGSSFFVLRQLGGCWESQALKGGLLVELEDANNSEDQFASILELAVRRQLPSRQANCHGLHSKRH
jgi:hypothetical protein